MKYLSLLVLLFCTPFAQAQTLAQELFHLNELRQLAPLKALRLAKQLSLRYPDEPALGLWLQELAKEIRVLPQQYLQLPSPGLRAMAFHAPSQLLYTLSADGYLRAWDLSTKQVKHQSRPLFASKEASATEPNQHRLLFQGQRLVWFSPEHTQVWSLDLQKVDTLPIVPAHYEKEDETPDVHAYHLYPDPAETDLIWLVFADSSRAWSLSKRRWLRSQALLFPKTEWLAQWTMLGPKLGFATLAEGFDWAVKSRKVLWQSPKAKRELGYQGKPWGGFCNADNLYLFDLDSASRRTLIRHYRDAQWLNTDTLAEHSSSNAPSLYAFASESATANWAYPYANNQVYWKLDDSTVVLLQQEAPVEVLLLSAKGDSLWVADADGMIFLWCKADIKPQGLGAVLHGASLSANKRCLFAHSEARDSLYWLGLPEQQLRHRMALPAGYTLKEYALLEQDWSVLVLAENQASSQYAFLRFDAQHLTWQQAFKVNLDFPQFIWGHSTASQSLVCTQDALLRLLDLKTGEVRREFRQEGLHFFSPREDAKIVWDAQGQHFALHLVRRNPTGGEVEVWRLSDFAPVFELPHLQMLDAFPLQLYDTALLLIENSPVSYGPVLYSRKGQRLMAFPHGQSYDLSADGRHLLCTDMRGGVYYYEVLSQRLLWKSTDYQPPYTIPPAASAIFSPDVSFLGSSAQYLYLASQKGSVLWNPQRQPVLLAAPKEADWLSLSAQEDYLYTLLRKDGDSYLFFSPLDQGFWARLPQWHLPSYHRVGAKLKAADWQAAWQLNPARKALDLAYLRASGQYQMAKDLSGLATIGEVISPPHVGPLNSLKITERYLITHQLKPLPSLPIYPLGDSIPEENFYSASALSFWDYRRDRLQTVGNFKDPILDVQISPQGDYAAVHTQNAYFFFVLGADTVRYISSLSTVDSPGEEAWFSPSGRFWVCSADKRLKIWRLSDLKLQRQITFPMVVNGENPLKICLSWDADRLAFYYPENQEIILREIKMLLPRLTAQRADALCFNQAGDLWYAPKLDTLYLWRNNNPVQIRIPLADVQFFSDKLLVKECLGDFCAFRYYDLETGALLRSLVLPQQFYTLSPNGQYLIGADGRVWSWTSDQALGQLPFVDGEKYELYELGGKDMIILCYFAGEKVQFIRFSP